MRNFGQSRNKIHANFYPRKVTQARAISSPISTFNHQFGVSIILHFFVLACQNFYQFNFKPVTQLLYLFLCSFLYQSFLELEHQVPVTFFVDQYPLGTGRKLNVRETFRRCHRCLNVLCPEGNTKKMLVFPEDFPFQCW